MSDDPYWDFEIPSLASELNEVREYLGMPETETPEDVCIAATRAIGELGRCYAQELMLAGLIERWSADPVASLFAEELRTTLDSVD